MGYEGITQIVFVNDHLTPYKKLLSTTKVVLKPKGYLYIWVKFGKIHVRKDDSSKIIILNMENDLNKLSWDAVRHVL